MSIQGFREMARLDANSITTSQSQQQLQMVALAQCRRPSLNLVEDTQEARAKYLNLCIPLQNAARKGDWQAIWHIIKQDSALLRAAITERWATVLHIAAEANQIHLVKELVKLMDTSDLELQDREGNTAFWLAAKFGNLQITEIMWQENIYLPTIRDGEGVTPINMAALKGESEMAWYLYPKTVQIFEERDWTGLFFNCIHTGLYDLALELLKERPKLAFARDGNNETGLHVLARKPSCRKPSCSSCPSSAYRKQIMNSRVNQNLALKLVKCLWKEVILLKPSSMMEIIRKPSNVIFYAAEVGNLDFLAELMSTYPEIVREVDSRSRSIIHIAVLHRHAGIFNLIHEIGPFKDFIVSRVDNVDKSNLLHLAAKLAPRDRLKTVAGAAFQMMLELSWFKEVEKIVPPSSLEMKNSDGLTPSQLFTVEHEELMKEAEPWMMRMANSGKDVSALIGTSVFSAAFSILGGNNDNTVTPRYMEKPSFLIFFLSDALAFISSSISIVLFLSILFSRCAEEDFLKSLPLKLISGLIALFISIISMLVSFSSVFFVTYHGHGLKWFPSLISVLAFAPVPLFVCLHFSLWSDILYTTYSCKSPFRPTKRVLY